MTTDLRRDSPGVAEEVVQAIEACCARSFRRVFPPRFSFRRMAEEFVSERRCREQLALARRCLPFDLVGKRVLEIGSAYGMMLAVARLELGVEAFGVEPGEKFEGTFALSGRVLSGLGIDPGIVRQGTGEAIPYESGSFDVVFSWNVLEHVADPAKVFAESVRVLRPGGCLFFVFPNYGSWWEGHYGILWWPDLPRGLAKAYVRLLGRDPAFVDTLQLLNRRRIEQCLAPLEGSVRVREWGTAIWEERLRTLDVADWALLARLRKIVRWVKALGLTELVIRLGRRLSWETPFVLVVEKTSP